MRNFKNLFVLAPAFGASLAFAFETGYFFGLDIFYFSFFSLSEHIVFAISMLPLTLLAAYGLMLIYSVLLRLNQAVDLESRLALLSLIICVLALTAAVISFYFNRLGWGLIGISVAVSSFAVSFTTEREARNQMLQVSALLLIVCFSFSFGSFMGADYLRERGPIHKMELKGGGSIDGRFVRSAERGVLFFDTREQKLFFQKWDEVSRIEGKPRFTSMRWF